MNRTFGPSPGAAQQPWHSLRIAGSDRHWVVRAVDAVPAASRKTLIVEESRYQPAVYNEAAVLAGHIASYADRVEVITEIFQ